MRFREAIDRPLEVGEENVDDLGEPRGDAEQRAAAPATERTAAVGGRFVARELIKSTVDGKLRARNRNPGDVRRTVIAAAHAAMAMTTEERRERNGKAHRSAETAALYLVARHALALRCLTLALYGAQNAS